jgi:chromatin remodeling complex protein RSC6
MPNNPFKSTGDPYAKKGDWSISAQDLPYADPTKITKELCEFMQLEENSKVARTDVTRTLISYIKEHKLQDPTNKKRIVPDEKLKNLLGLENEDELTYFNIQKHMNKHFIKENKPHTELNLNEV